jgi:hypothetical protein
MFSREHLSLRRSTSLENNWCALGRGVSGSVRSTLVVFSVKEDLVDLVRIVRSLWSFPGLGSVFPGAFPEAACD